jgi:hypothetical protein
MSIGENGILEKVNNAKITVEKALFREQVELDINEVLSELYIENNPITLENIVAKLITDKYGYHLSKIEDLDASDDEIDSIDNATNVTISKNGGSAVIDSDITVVVEEAPTNKPPEAPLYVGGHYNETKGVNTPKIISGLIPVTINANGTPNIVENPNTDDWYSYKTTDKRWANAITKNSNGDITGYWVWIPRYSYQITSQYHTGGTDAGNINIKFLKDKGQEYDGETITIGTVPEYSGNVQTNYVVHPAFTNEVSKGGWDDNLRGIWVAKFPAGYAGGNNNVEKVSTGINYSGTGNSNNFYGSVNTSTPIYYPVFLPETYAYNNINIGDSFNLTQNLGKSENIYGLKTNANPHQMKNSEWGAVAYLTQSSYGINGNIYINNINLNNSPSTIYGITGWVSDGPDTVQNNTVTIAQLNSRSATGENVWYSSNGQKGSSTGNLYGIYDLSGCIWEGVTAYIENNNGSTYRTWYGGALTQSGTDKLRTKYDYHPSDTRPLNYDANSSKYGDAIYEVSTNGDSPYSNSWYSDSSNFVYLNPFMIRGGRL